MGNLEGAAPQSGDTTGNPLEGPADHAAGWIEREREDPYGLDRLSELARDVTANAAGIVWPGLHRPVERELTFPSGHQGGGRCRGRQAAADGLAGRGGQGDQSEPDPGDGEADLARHTLPSRTEPTTVISIPAARPLWRKMNRFAKPREAEWSSACSRS